MAAGLQRAAAGPGLGTGVPRFAALPGGCFFLAAATFAWYALYLVSFRAQVFCVVYALGTG